MMVAIMVEPIQWLGEQRWPCPECKKLCKSLAGLQQHSNWCQIEPKYEMIPCAVCGTLTPRTTRTKRYCSTSCKHKAFYYNHHEECLKYRREYYTRNKEEIKRKAKKREGYNQGYSKTRWREWYDRNKERQAEYNRRYYLEHRDEILRKSKGKKKTSRDKSNETEAGQ